MSFAMALPDYGKVVACDICEEYANIGKPVWKEVIEIIIIFEMYLTPLFCSIRLYLLCVLIPAEYIEHIAEERPNILSPFLFFLIYLATSHCIPKSQ